MRAGPIGFRTPFLIGKQDIRCPFCAEQAADQAGSRPFLLHVKQQRGFLIKILRQLQLRLQVMDALCHQAERIVDDETVDLQIFQERVAQRQAAASIRVGDFKAQEHGVEVNILPLLAAQLTQQRLLGRGKGLIAPGIAQTDILKQPFAVVT
ncbi:hypothetical protein SDC9_89842 [bioreactor metagenome]|uniref:Uncharacterized protein n=1 Tax=bioreactor metagenome TaxID=1076179 RepID=A0A644ZQB5_9ZZZZ